MFQKILIVFGIAWALGTTFAYGQMSADSSFCDGQFITFNGRLELHQVEHIFVEDGRAGVVSVNGHSYLMELDGYNHALGRPLLKSVVLLFADGTWARGDTITVTHILGERDRAGKFQDAKKELQYWSNQLDSTEKSRDSLKKSNYPY